MEIEAGVPQEAGVQRELTVAWGCRLKGCAWPGHHLEGKEQLAVGCMGACFVRGRKPREGRPAGSVAG